MTNLVTSENVHEDQPHTFVGFASDLELAPGLVPSQLKTTLGNGQNLVYVRANNGVFIFRQLLGCVEVHLFND